MERPSLPSASLTGRDLKKKVLGLLQAEHFEKSLDEMRSYPGRPVVNSLLSFLLHKEEIIRWKAVTAMGVVVGNLAQQDMEEARTTMRRLMWSLNEESGGIGWGAPESMAEIMACNDELAWEYGNIFVSYFDRQGNYLEHEVLQRGLLWGLVRLSGARPEVVEAAVPHVVPYLTSPDATVRGLAAWAAGILKIRNARGELMQLLDDDAHFTAYVDGKLMQLCVKELARDALANLM